MGTLDVTETDAENSIDTGSHEAREGKQVEEARERMDMEEEDLIRERMDLEEEELINAQESRESVVTETAREDTAQDRLFVDILSLVKPPRPRHPPRGHHHQHHGGQHQHDTHPGKLQKDILC